MKGRALIIDDEPSMCELLAVGLKKRDFDPVCVTSAAAAVDLLAAEDFDVVVTDVNMRGLDGIELCKHVVSNRPDVPVIVITAFGSMETAIAAMRAGAYDFIPKPVDLDTLQLALERGIGHHRLRTEVKRLREAVAATQRSGNMRGASAPMKQVYDLIDRVAQTDASVLITGESGTGKELVAQALHQRSARSSGPFVAINCAAMPDTLLESELFGHVKGAFTDARSSRAGLFVQASGGTLLLDEVGELSLALQPKLLRALQERKVRPVGGDSEVPFDARIVAATNRDLETAALEHRFREDLYYRINVIHIDVPPLRARGPDVLLLAQHFVLQFASTFGKQVKGLSKPAAEKLSAYSWPGNVRELQNCMERAVALTRFEEILVEDLPDKVQSYKRSQVVLDSGDPSELVSLDELERRYILRVLEALNGNKTLAAQTLGLDRKTLYRKLQQYGVG
ncbi:MAG TPA: sigma-54 dependent transcriptional regulator, partial [Polyangiales bacterium]